MPSGAISAQGTVVSVSTQSTTGGSYTAIADLENIAGPSESNRFIEITNHSSSAVERLATLNDPGEVTLTLSFGPDKATHGASGNGLRSLLRSQAKRMWRVVYPTTTGTDIDQFQGTVSTFNVTAPTADVLRAECGIQILGAISEKTST